MRQKRSVEAVQQTSDDDSDADDSSELEEDADLTLSVPNGDVDADHVIQVDFEFFDPTEEDFWAVKSFVRNCKYV